MRRSLGALTTAVVAVLSASVGAASAQAPTREQFVVTGLVVVDGGEGSAWLQEPTLTENRIVRVHRGDRVGPWRVRRILADRVEFEGPDGSASYVILGGATAPGKRIEITPGSAEGQGGIVAPAVSVDRDVAAQAHALATGGDEGVWHDGESSSTSTAAAAPSAPTAAGRR